MPPKPKLINLTKPVLQSTIKMRPFVWKKINLDFENGGQVAKKDLKGVDPAWKDKKVVWKEVKENKDITLQMCEDLFADKVKVVETKV